VRTVRLFLIAAIVVTALGFSSAGAAPPTCGPVTSVCVYEQYAGCSSLVEVLHVGSFCYNESDQSLRHYAGGGVGVECMEGQGCFAEAYHGTSTRTDSSGFQGEFCRDLKGLTDRNSVAVAAGSACVGTAVAPDGAEMRRAEAGVQVGDTCRHVNDGQLDEDCWDFYYPDGYNPPY
jgi:hypothetical protein